MVFFFHVCFTKCNAGKLYWRATSSRRVPFLASALLRHFSYIILCVDKMMSQSTGEIWYSVRTGHTPVYVLHGNIVG